MLLKKEKKGRKKKKKASCIIFKLETDGCLIITHSAISWQQTY
jgi:hypothetical protein